MSTGSGIHAGHRQRMKERFLAGGLEGFSEHEVLELILFYAIPRRDVNELSHKLVERFGSLRAVFDADFEDLLTVDGIGENAALLIKLMAESFRKYALSDGEDVMLYDTLQKVGEYAVKLYIGVSVEKLYALLFDNKMMLLDTVMLGEGAVNSVHVSVRTIAEKALKKDASSIILLHNHPNGLPYPSDDDRRFSAYLKDLLANFDITLIDHIIVSGRFYRPVFEGEVGENKFAAPNSFSYGEKIAPTGIRVCETKAAADIAYKGNTE
jgi:DNA repair protein RadC